MPDHDIATLAALHRDIGILGERMRSVEHATTSLRKDVDEVIRADDIAQAVASELRERKIVDGEAAQHHISTLAAVAVTVAALASATTLILNVVGVI